MNGSIKENIKNITFCNSYEKEKYENVVSAYALLKDFFEMDSADHTEIGERGVSLSGGQKQRISLSRCVYEDRDIYLLDDPLSSLDNQVADHLIKHVLSDDGQLKNKSRIAVGHNVSLLKEAVSITCVQMLLK